MPDLDILAAELERSLERLILLLQRHAESHWAGQLQAVLPLIKQRDARGLDLLAGMYGGMGSLNDLILAKVNGHNICDNEETGANAALQTGLNRAYEITAELRRAIVLRSLHQKQSPAIRQRPGPQGL